MKTPVKVILTLVGVTGAGYGAYRIYKWWKEEDKLEAEGLSYEELVAAAEAKKMEKKIEENKAREEEFDKAKRDIEGLPNDGLDWYKTPEGDIQRELTPYEKKFGVDYNPLEEELVEEYDIDNNVFEFVRKFKEGTKLLNHRDDKRTVNDIVEQTREMTAQIKALKVNDMEHDKRIYDDNTQESYDYYRALVMDRASIENEELRDNLALLFSWEYIPTKENIGDSNLREDIIRARKEYFKFGTIYSDWASIGEAIIHYAMRLQFSTNIGTVEQYADWILDTMGLDLQSDLDPVINDTIISFFEHHRHNKPNADGTYGLFHIPEEEYKESLTLWHEHNHAVSLIVNDQMTLVFGIKGDK